MKYSLLLTMTAAALAVLPAVSSALPLCAQTGYVEKVIVSAGAGPSRFYLRNSSLTDPPFLSATTDVRFIETVLHAMTHRNLVAVGAVGPAVCPLPAAGGYIGVANGIKVAP